MATGSLVSIEEYLHTTYRPDCDYVDGVVLERNLGEYDHAKLQTAIAAFYDNRSEQWGIDVVTEQRVQVAPTRFRVPDVCVTIYSAAPQQIFRTPPFICIEILSKDDRLSELQDRIDDYLNFGVPYVWLLDPARRKAFRCTTDGMQEVTEFRTTNPDTVLSVAELFRRLRPTR
jgi:Uma2 family endonuclease